MGGEPKFKIDDGISMRDYLLGISVHEKNLEGLNRIEYWSQHVRQWISAPGILLIDYEELVKSRDGALEKISQHIGIPIYSSPNATTPTGIGRHFTDRFLAQGGDAVWSADIVQAVKTTLEKIAGEQPVLESYVRNWLLATP